MDELWAYNVLPPPHRTSMRSSRDVCFSSCSGSFPGFMGLRFICLLSALFFAEKGEGKMCAKCILEEKAENVVKVIRAAVVDIANRRETRRIRGD